MAKQEERVPTEVKEALTEVSKIKSTILELRKKQEALIESISDKVAPVLEELRKKTDTLISKKNSLLEKKQALNLQIAELDNQIRDLISQRVELGEKTVTAKGRANSSKLREDIAQSLKELGVPVEVKVVAKTVAEKRGTEQGTVRQGIQKYCITDDLGKVIGMA